MPTWVNNIQKRLDTLSRRERISAYIITCVLVLIAWDFALYQPLSSDVNKLEQDIAQLDKQLVDTDRLILTIQQNMQADPDDASRTLLAEYTAENLRLDQALEKNAVLIISPQDMAKLLEQILKSQSRLKFISLQNIAAVPQSLDADTTALVNTLANAPSQGIIFRHSVVLKMEGSYHDTLAYLHKLEQLPWHFSWKSIDIETREYPTLQITLEVYTFSLKRGLIGV